MNDEAALLAAILANPDEDTPRLVFADWLDENGHPERAEFIRVQIEVTRLPEAERYTPHYRALLIRFRQLIVEHAGAWSRALGVPPTRVIFRRGFIEEGTFTVAELPTATNRALLREPLRTVRVKRSSREQSAADTGVPVLLRLASWPGRGRFHTLHLCDLTIPPLAVEPFFASPALADLRALDIAECSFPPETVIALTESTNLSKLEYLGLGRIGLSVEQVYALARTPNLKNLRTVGLSVRYDPPAEEGAPNPMYAAINALQTRYGDADWPTGW